MAETKTERKEAWEAEQARLRQEQGLSEGQVPERRPQAFTVPADNTGEVQKRMRAEGSPMADNAPAHGFEEHEKSRKSAEREDGGAGEQLQEIMYPGTHAYINNQDGEGKEHHGRAVAINRVNEYESPAQNLLANSAYDHNRRYAKVKSYEVSTRDGRAELLIVSAEHLTKVPVTEYHRTVT